MGDPARLRLRSWLHAILHSWSAQSRWVGKVCSGKYELLATEMKDLPRPTGMKLRGSCKEEAPILMPGIFHGKV